jgi:hypothetical protein
MFKIGRTRRSKENHSSIVVRRDVVPQPSLVFHGIFRRSDIALFGGYLGERVTEDLVNCVAPVLCRFGHSGISL